MRSLVAARAAFGPRNPAGEERELVEAVKEALVPLQNVLRQRLLIDKTEDGVGIATDTSAGLHPNAEFAKKKLATHVVNVGKACSHLCVYCSSTAMLRTQNVNLMLGLDGENTGFAIIDPDALDAVKKSKATSRLTSSDVVLVCATVDAWAPEARKYDLGGKLVEYLLRETPAQLRVLTKNASIAEDLPRFAGYEQRVIIGLSTGIPASRQDVASVLEPNASPITQRLAALRRAHELGFRTFGMLCPCPPGVSDQRQALEEMVDAVLAAGVEAIWLEPINWYGKANKLTVAALTKAGFVTEAEAAAKSAKREPWSEYALQLVRQSQGIARQKGRAEDLQILLYRTWLTSAAEQAMSKDPTGLVMLGNRP